MFGIGQFPAKFVLDSCSCIQKSHKLLIAVLSLRGTRTLQFQREIERETDTFIQKPVPIGLNGSEEMDRELFRRSSDLFGGVQFKHVKIFRHVGERTWASVNCIMEHGIDRNSYR